MDISIMFEYNGNIEIRLPSREDIHEAYLLGEEHIADLVTDLTKTIGRLTDIIGQQAEEIRRLKDQTVKDSGNSSKPPSTDGPRKRPRNNSLREPSGKPNGGQPGHKGHCLNAVDKPDIIISHKPEKCEHCHASLDGAKVVGHDKRQVFDIPPIRIEVTEHRAEIVECPICNNKTQAEFPDDVVQPTQYGPRLKAHAAYLNVDQLIPLKRTAEICENIFGQGISEGTVIAAVEELAQKVSPASTATKEKLTASETVSFDESGFRVNKKTLWLHVASTEELTYYGVNEKRGVDAMNDIGILPNFKGTAGHDHWKPYFSFSNCDHSLCNAHHLRELKFVVEQYGQIWAKDMSDLLIDIKREVEQTRPVQDHLDPEKIKVYENRYDEIVEEGLKVNPQPAKTPGKRGRIKQTPPKNLLDRLKEKKKETLAFMYDFRVDFCNNKAERDVRMPKVKQKISGCFRTKAGADRFAKVFGYISTARKNNINAIDAISMAFSGGPFIPGAE